MDFNYQILFLFSAIGAINGFFLGTYFAFFIKNKSRATYFLSALIFAISVRVTKSVFLIYDPSISTTFIQIGLTACALIGPFLYLYVREHNTQETAKQSNGLSHILPVLISMLLVSYYLPYDEYRYLWQRRLDGYLGWILFTQWLTYVILSGFQIKDSFRKWLSKQEEASDQDIWLISVVLGVGIIWIAYNTSSFTSYIVGALSFSFVFYLMLLVWVFKKRRSATFLAKQVKYANKKIGAAEAQAIESRLEEVFDEQQLYKNPDLKLSELAQELDLAPNVLSQYLNDNLKKSFSTFINEYRVHAAEDMLKTNQLLTLEAIGQECGFKSNSAFYAACKKFKGITPGQLKKTMI